MTRDERRRRDRSKALSRMRLYVSKAFWRKNEDYTLGKFTNNNYVNMTCSNRKTNHRKGHSNYRSKGQYSNGDCYTASDQRKMDSLDSSLNEEWTSEED